VVVAFFDTSALARLYLRSEPDAARVTRFVQDSENSIAVSALTPVEMASLIARRQREGTMTPLTAEAIAAEFAASLRTVFERVALDPAVMDRAASLVGVHVIRSLDAVQIAAALMVAQAMRGSFQFWTADRRQAAAAEAEDLEVVLLA